MSGEFSWPLADGSAAVSLQSSVSLDATMRKLFGRDIWLDVSAGNGIDRIVTPAGDWKLVEGEAAVRQSLLRRLVTNPGEWKTKPDYGVGARQFVKGIGTKARHDELTNRIYAQFALDKRVEAIRAVSIATVNGVLKIDIAVQLKGRNLHERPMLVSIQLR